MKYVRIGVTVSGWNSVEDDDSVRQISGHDEVVLHHKCGLLGVKDESAWQRKEGICEIRIRLGVRDIEKKWYLDILGDFSDN